MCPWNGCPASPHRSATKEVSGSQCRVYTRRGRAGGEKAALWEVQAKRAKLKLVTKKGRCRHELGANAVKSLFVCDPDVSDTSVLD